MRELKFRAWGIQDNEYITGNRIRVDGDGLLYIDRITVKNCFRPPHSRKNPWFIVEQYTGLKDKNGREIYEGDIVSVRDSPVVVEDEKGVCYVAWSSVLAGFILKGSDAYKFDEQSLSDLKLIIIGNIHENLELLEKK